MADKSSRAAYTAAYNKANYARIELKIPKEVKANWEYQASLEGLSLTSWIRKRCDTPVPPTED